MEPEGESIHPARARLRALLADFASRTPPIRVVRKSAYWHQRAADVALRVVTLNGQRTYLSRYVTTLGHTIYVPDDFDAWPAGRAWQILRHEAVHVAQFERFGWLGMILIYGVLPLPMGLAYGRARLEWQAYAETLRAVAELEGIEGARSPELRDEIIRRFTGPDYGWMWPFPAAVGGWINAELDKIERHGTESDATKRRTAEGAASLESAGDDASDDASGDAPKSAPKSGLKGKGKKPSPRGL